MREKQRLGFRGASQRSRLENLRLRAKCLAAFRHAMEKRGILEVETPTWIKYPGLEPHLEAVSVPPCGYLATSPEYQMKRLLAGGSGSIYYLGKAYRRGERGPHHNPEFTMAEWYRVGMGYRQLMEETAEIVAEVAEDVIQTTKVPLPTGGTFDLAPPWEVVTVSEAFEKLAGVPLVEECAEAWEEPTLKATKSLCAAASSVGVRIPKDATWEEAFFRVFVQLVEPKLHRDHPVFLTDWPVTLSALSQIRREPGRRAVAERFEVFACGLELANAFGELRESEEQRRRLDADIERRKQAGRPIYAVDEAFLEALREGMPPCSGIAMGFDRLVMLLAGAAEIREVMTFVYEEL